MNDQMIDVGHISNNKIIFPQLHAKTEQKEQTENRDDYKQKVGFAVIGLGRISINHMIPAFLQSKHAKLVAVVSGRPRKAKLIAQQYNIKYIYGYNDFENIKNNPEIHAVYIALPVSMHCEYTIKSALAGKHVFCEKPMAINTDEAKKMIDICFDNNRLLMIGYRMQYDVFGHYLKEIGGHPHSPHYFVYLNFLDGGYGGVPQFIVSILPDLSQVRNLSKYRQKSKTIQMIIVSNKLNKMFVGISCFLPDALQS